MAKGNGKRLIGRRQFTIGLGAAALAAPFVARSAMAQSGKRIIVPTYGGTYQEKLQTAFTKPFTEETGIEVVFSGVPDLARLKAQVQSGRPEWDVFDASGPWFPTGSQQGLFEPLDTSVVDSKLIAGEGDYAKFYGNIGCISWNGDRYTEENAPQTWEQFWDVEKFPGRRTLRSRADMLLEMALVADGVAPDQLYPLDVERAFRSLERIKPSITKWASSASELTTLTSTNEVDFGLNYAGRIRGANEAGTPLRMSREQVCLNNEYLGIVKGSPNVEAAMQFIAFVLKPERQVVFANLDSVMPADPAVVELMSEEAKQWLPADAMSPGHIRQNEEWWVGRSEELQQRLLSFLLT